MPDRLDESFSLTARLLFGKPLGPLKKYEKWLQARVPTGKGVKSCFGRGEAYVPEYGACRIMPKGRISSEEDLPAANSKKIDVSSASSLSSMKTALPVIAYFVPAYAEGNNVNAEKSFLYFNCMNIRHCFDPFTSKGCAYAFSIMDSEGLFGAHRVKGSFSMHCYNSLRVQRCFEMDGAINCCDSYFCHNVENLQDCIFCFNAKGMRYAVGNVEIGKEKYLAFKQKLLARIVPQIETQGGLDFDIYDILCRQRKKHTE